MHSPTRPRTESRQRGRMRSSFFTIMHRLSASSMSRSLCPVLEVIEEAGPRQGGLGLHGGLIVGLLLSQSHAGSGHVGVAHLAERGLILELELLSHIRGVGNLILNAAVELELLGKIALGGLNGAERGRNPRLIVGRQRRPQASYSQEYVTGIRRTRRGIAMIENLLRGQGYGKGDAGCILDQTRGRRRNQLVHAGWTRRIQLIGRGTGLIAVEYVLAVGVCVGGGDELRKDLGNLLRKHRTHRCGYGCAYTLLRQ